MLSRVDKKIEDNIGEDQFGFRKVRGTRDAIGCLKMLAERFLEVNRDIYV